MSARDVARVTPIALLAAVAVVALATRSKPHAPPAPVAVTNAVASASVRPPLERPLVADVPPDASVPLGAARLFHGSAQRTHRGRARGPTAIHVGWRVPVDGAIAAQVTASPDESTLYVATLGGDLVALARTDGQRRWTRKLGDRAYATPLVADDGIVYAGSDAKKLVALDPSAGSVVFQLETDGEVDTSPVFARDGTIIVAAGTQVLAVRRGGDVAWRYSARKKLFTAPALTADGLVVVGGQDHRVRALGAGGAEAWSTDLGADVDGGAAIGDDGAIYVGTDAGEVVRLDDKGVVTWRANVGGFVRGSLSVARNGDVLAGTYGPVPRVVRVGADGFVRGAFAIAGTGAKEFGIHGGPLEDAEGILFFGTQDDGVYALDREGAVRWRFSTGADVDAPLTLLGDGSLVVPSEDGTVTLLLP